MNDIFIKISGLVSDTISNKIYSELGITKAQKNSSLIFIDYSYFNIPLGYKFSYLIKVSDRVSVSPIRAELQLVTQQWGKLFCNGIPEGHKTICNIIFNTESKKIISDKISIVDQWKEMNELFLFSNVNGTRWNKYYDYPATKNK